MASDWYYTSKGQQAGPVSSQKLKELADFGYIQPNDLVWKDGMSDWSPASKVKGLFRNTPAPEPPPPPAPPRQTIPVQVKMDVPVRLVAPKEGIPERIAKWATIGWSLLCLVGVVFGMFNVAASSDPTYGNQYAEAGQVIGVGCGLAIWFVIWAVIAIPSLVIWLLMKKR
jgi:hypothetical protein